MILSERVRWNDYDKKKLSMDGCVMAKGSRRIRNRHEKNEKLMEFVCI